MFDRTKRIEDDKTKRLEVEEATKRLPPGAGTQPLPLLLNLDLPKDVKIIEDKYVVVHSLSTSGGEADVYLCRSTDRSKRQVVVKLYRMQLKPKTDILEKIKGIKHPDIIEVIDYGFWQERFYEIMEYAEGGVLLENLPFTEERLVKNVIPEVINALKYIHSKGIIHRDLKPTNLFYRDKNKTDIVLGDFGISSIIEGSEVTSVMTSRHRTSAYAAPEIFSGVVSRQGEADYYAFGITLIHLLTGANPFAALDDMRIMAIHTSEEIPLPDCSERFQMLLRGLLVKERKKRWNYNQVERWLRGEDVPVYQDEIGLIRTGIPVFKFKTGAEARSYAELADLLENDPETAHRHFGRGTISAWLKPFDQAKGIEVNDVEELAGNPEAAVTEIIYILDPTRPYYLTREQSANTPEDLVRDIERDSYTWEQGRAQLYNGRILAWLKRTGYPHLVESWRKLEKSYKQDQDEGLEAFLHILEPDLGKPILNLNRKKVNFGWVQTGSKKAITLNITNRARGYMAGSLNLKKNIDGITVSKHQFKGKKTEIKFSADTEGLRPGKKKKTSIIFESNAQNSPYSIPLVFRVAFPIFKIARLWVLWGLLGVVIALGFQLGKNISTGGEILDLAPALPLVLIGFLLTGTSIGLWKSANKFKIGYLKVFAILFFLIIGYIGYSSYQPTHGLRPTWTGSVPIWINQQIDKIGSTFKATKKQVTGDYVGVIIAPQGANVRKEPEANSPRIGVVQPDVKVTVLEKQNSWFKIRFGANNQTGYVYEKLISVSGWDSRSNRIQDDGTIQAPGSKVPDDQIYISVSTRPPGAFVQIGDKKLGPTPFGTFVNVGTVAIRVELEGYQEHSETIQFEQGGKTDYHFELVEK